MAINDIKRALRTNDALFSASTSRRSLLKAGGLAATGAILGLGTPSVRAQVPAQIRRFVQINLEGGWNSLYATDPVIGSKRATDTYEPVFLSTELDPKTMASKPSLVLGPGLIPAESAFAQIPTAFVNGIFIEVSSHDFAAQFMSSGILSLSNTRDYPSMAARLGAASATFPPHVVLGLGVPLGDTRTTSPPLQAWTLESLAAMVNGPSPDVLAPTILTNHYNPALVSDAHALIASLDNSVRGRLPEGYQNELELWMTSSTKVDQIYALGLRDKLTPSQEMMTRYGFSSVFEFGPEISLASLMLLLQSNLSLNLTATFGSFDTHTDELAVHVPLMKRFAAALVPFVEDLLSTDDPAVPGKKLADTTTVLITSEFNRTPKFSEALGTEHWQSASAIVIGAGVNDGAVIGATGDDANALGWDGAQAVPATELNRLYPHHLVASILAHVGNDQIANEVTIERLPTLFTT